MRWRVRCARSDPRTNDQRRADALGALAHGADRLACACDDPDCDAAGTQPSTVVVHVITHEDSLSDDTPVQWEGQEPPHPVTKPLLEMTLREALTPAPSGPDHRRHRTGGTAGWRDAARPAVGGQDRRHRQDRADPATPATRRPQRRYIPSAVLATFVRCRDMTCRFPGCDEPAQPLRYRPHHRLPRRTDPGVEPEMPVPKTPLTQNVRRLARPTAPDGTVVWTSPHGQTYTTHPGSRLLFPTLCKPTAPVTHLRRPLRLEPPTADWPCPDAQQPAHRTAPKPSTTNADTTKSSSKPRQKHAHGEQREDPENACDETYFPSRPRPRATTIRRHFDGSRWSVLPINAAMRDSSIHDEFHECIDLVFVVAPLADRRFGERDIVKIRCSETAERVGSRSVDSTRSRNASTSSSL